jgi:hypothetical protein
MTILIFTNCQGNPLARLLSEKNIENYKYHNFHYIYHTVLDENFKKHLETCDYFIYQPLSSAYPVYNTENLKSYLKPSCITISFPYIFNDAFSPIFKTYKYDLPMNGEYSTIETHSIIYKNIHPILTLKQKGLSFEEVLDLYEKNQIDFLYKERFNRSIHILKEKEKETDIKVSDFILNNYKKYKLFNYHCESSNTSYCNHPSNILINYYINKILELMNLPSFYYEGPELIGEKMLVSRYDIAFFEYEWIKKESEGIDTMVKQIMYEVYNSF